MHKPVLLNEVIEYLNIKPETKIIDATINGGGHAKGILEKYPDAKILGIEFDPVIFQEFQRSDLSRKVIAVNDSYTHLKKIVAENDFHPDGIIFDLGLSSWQLGASGRGFSFQRDEPLDMRFNPDMQKLTAAQIINTYGAQELERVIRDYGEESFAPQIARMIVVSRKAGPLLTTFQLVEVIRRSVPEWYKHKKINPATKTFQALRIAVNDELNNVAEGINAGLDVLNKHGRLAVIAFHGLEDKIVREIFKERAKKGDIAWVVKGTIKPKWEEVKNNPRARSAKMKVVEKL